LWEKGANSENFRSNEKQKVIGGGGGKYLNQSGNTLTKTKKRGGIDRMGADKDIKAKEASGRVDQVGTALRGQTCPTG